MNTVQKCGCLRCKDCTYNKQKYRKVCSKCRDARCECQYCGQVRKKCDTNESNPRCDCYKKNKFKFKIKAKPELIPESIDEVCMILISLRYDINFFKI